MARRARRRTVVSRVLLSYAVITVSFVLVAGYSVVGQRRSVRETELMRSGYLPLALALRDAVSSQNTYNTQLNHITEVSNPADKRVWFDTALSVGRPKVFAEVRSALNRAFGPENDAIRHALQQEIAHIQSYLEADRETLARLFEALRQQDLQRAEELRDVLVTRGTQSANMLRELENRVIQQVDLLIREASLRERWTLRVLLAWAAFTVALGIAVALYARKVLRPLIDVTQRAKAVAAGDLSPREVVAANDEVGDLARTFEAMVAAIARANQELLDAERLATIGKMAAHVTHEVRNPLSSIALNLELLEDELQQDEAEARSLFVAIRREVERLTELTEQYLSMARRSEPHFEWEDVREVIEEALQFVNIELARNRIALEQRIAANLPKVWMDEAQIRQVLVNLIRNARQAMPEGGQVIVESRLLHRAPASHGGTSLEISVSDTGPGLDQAARERLFEPFFTTKGHGTGLGLAISRHIVEAHHGRIRCEQNEPSGARFIIELPLEPQPDSDLARRRLPSVLEST